MSRGVRVHQDAADEAEAAVAWYEQQHEGLGAALKVDFDRLTERLRSGFETGSPLPGHTGRSGARRLVLSRFPYDVVFVLTAGEAVILAYAHHARRPGFWRQRQESLSPEPQP